MNNPFKRNPAYKKTPIGTSSYADQIRLSHMRVSNVPGAGSIQRNHGAQPVTGVSGIVPFIRTNGGQALAPIAKSTGIANFFRLGKNNV